MWEKLGRVYKPVGKGWRKTHGFTPTPLVLNDRVRIYTGFCGKDKKFRIGYVDVEKDNPKKIIGISEKPVIDLGKPGLFDCDGMFPSYATYVDYNKVILLYSGWQFLQGKLKRLAFSGNVISDDDGETFYRVRSIPLLDRTEEEPCMRTMPVYMKHHFVYIGSRTYHILNGWYVPEYGISIFNVKDRSVKRILEVPDGYLGLGRPSIVKKNDKYHIWTSLRSFDVGYKKIICATCDTLDGTYTIQDNYGFGVSKEDWDSEMVCFPAIYTVDDNTYMLYCGNDYGKTGFGVARFIGE